MHDRVREESSAMTNISDPVWRRITIVFAAIFVSFSFLASFASERGIYEYFPLHADYFISGQDFPSERLIRNSIYHYADEGDSSTGGFMRAIDPKIHIAAVKQIDGSNVERSEYPYISHFGIQYQVAKFFTFRNTEMVEFAHFVARLMGAIGMASVIILIADWARRNFSIVHSFGVFAVFILSPAILEKSFSAYWWTFLNFLPFVFSLYAYPRIRSNGSAVMFLSVVSLLVCLKSLSGYEYITAVAISAAVPVIYYESKANSGMLPYRSYRFWSSILFIAMAAVVGFAIAGMLHIALAASYFGSFDKGMKALILPMTYSTTGAGTDIRSSSTISLISISLAWIKTLALRNAIINVAVFVPILAYLIFQIRDRISNRIDKFYLLDDANTTALVWMCLFAFTASVSWQMLALKHTVAHSHVNWITMYITLIPLAVVLSIQLFVQRRSIR